MRWFLSLLSLLSLPLTVQAEGALLRNLTQLVVSEELTVGQDWQRTDTGAFPFELVCVDCTGVLGLNADLTIRDTAPAGAFAMESMSLEDATGICDGRRDLCEVRAVQIGTARGFAFDVGNGDLFSSSFVLYSADDRVSLRVAGTSAEIVSATRDRALAAFGPQLFGDPQ